MADARTYSSLPASEQIFLLRKEGRDLHMELKDGRQRLKLYELGNFYVALIFDQAQSLPVNIRLLSLDELDPFLQEINISDLI